MSTNTGVRSPQTSALAGSAIPDTRNQPEHGRLYPGAPENCLDDVDSDCDGLTCPAREERQLENLADGADSGTVWLTPGIADFDGDGTDELVLSTPSPAELWDTVYRFDLPLPQGTLDLDLDATGRLAGGTSGAWVHSIGDIDGDGDPDLAVSTKLAPGEVALVDSIRSSGDFASIDDRIMVGTARATGEALSTFHSAFPFGQAVGVGDQNNDGKDDFLLSAPNADGSGELRGEVYLVTASVQGTQRIRDLTGTTFTGEHDEAYLGTSLGRAGDLDGDGLSELIIDENGWSSITDGAQTGRYQGRVVVFDGGSRGSTVSTDARATVQGAATNARARHGTTVGDIDGDGHDDLALQLFTAFGQALFYLGPVEGDLGSEHADHKLIGEAGDRQTAGFGQTITGLGDLDRDGFDDVLISAPTEDALDGTIMVGAQYLYYGPLTGVLAPEHAARRWEASRPRGGPAQSILADLDGDEALDLLVSGEAVVRSDQPSPAELLVDWSALSR